MWPQIMEMLWFVDVCLTAQLREFCPSGRDGGFVNKAAVSEMEPSTGRALQLHHRQCSGIILKRILPNEACHKKQRLTVDA